MEWQQPIHSCNDLTMVSRYGILILPVGSNAGTLLYTVPTVQFNITEICILTQILKLGKYFVGKFILLLIIFSLVNFLEFCAKPFQIEYQLSDKLLNSFTFAPLSCQQTALARQ